MTASLELQKVYALESLLGPPAHRAVPKRTKPHRTTHHAIYVTTPPPRHHGYQNAFSQALPTQFGLMVKMKVAYWLALHRFQFHFALIIHHYPLLVLVCLFSKVPTPQLISDQHPTVAVLL